PPGGSINNSFGGNSAISPDGRTVVFLATDSIGKSFLYVRPLRELTARRLQGTEGGYYPFWSPDNKSIGFFSNGKLKKMDVVGGSPLTICNAPSGRGATWGREGVIVFAGGPSSGLSRVSATGGEPAPLTTLDTSRSESSHRWPFFLPDGKHFLFLARSGRSVGDLGGDGLTVGSLDSPDLQPVMKVGSIVEYADGYLFYIVENSLMARAFDPVKLTLTGDPFTVAEQILFSTNMGKGDFSVSEAGDILYGIGASTEEKFLKWYDRSGKEVSTVGDPAAYIGLQLSPDGKRVALEEYNRSAGNGDIWIYDLERGTKSRLTFSADPDRTPVWSPEGGTIYYMSGDDIFKKNSNGIGAEIPILNSDAMKR
ncbi:MAG TPA: DPP IV N-terminal domain-containing protein, partial [Candidatus Krumholzibacterium sp.]|nr:DPP IV N-terminal domain-containing protein [Candidatus Krumholzibacterium sp.]